MTLLVAPAMGDHDPVYHKQFVYM